MAFSLRDTVHHGREGTAARARDWKVGYTALATKKHRMNTRWSQAVKLSGHPRGPLPAARLRLLKAPQSSQIEPSTEDQIFKYVSL